MRFALYFGYREASGHWLQGIPRSINRHEATIDPTRDVPGFPWNARLLDGGLLRNRGVADEPDGRVWWTCGGINVMWHAFFWWDRSGDKRPASNSGFYVRGYAFEERGPAFEFACAQWPRVVARQLHRLVLQP